MSVLRLALGRAARRTSPSCRGGLPRGFRAARRRLRAQAVRRARPRPARLRRARHRRAPPASRAPACSPRRCCSRQERCRLDALRAVVANAGNANAATGGRGLEDAARMQGAGAMAAGVREDRVAVASTGVIGVPLDDRQVDRAASLQRARRSSPRTATPASATAIRPPTRSRSARRSRSRCPSGTVRLCAQAKGAGMISPTFATMLCFVETDAALERRDRRPAARRVRQALVRPHLGRRPALDQRHGDPDGVAAPAACAIAPESRGRAALRRGARRAAAPARAADRRATARAPSGSAACSCTAATREAVERAARAVANSPLVKAALQRRRPELGPDRAGGRRARCPTPRRCRSTSGSRASRSAAAAPACRSTTAALAGAVAGDEVEYVVGLPGEGAETEVFFSDLSHDYVPINAEYTT